jgi:gluconolactonase
LSSPHRKISTRLYNTDGTKTRLADRYMGKRLNRPNDLALKSNGDLYFTDPHFYDSGRELDFAGVYCLTPSNELTLLTQKLEAPNGIPFSARREIALHRQL